MSNTDEASSNDHARPESSSAEFDGAFLAGSRVDSDELYARSGSKPDTDNVDHGVSEPSHEVPRDARLAAILAAANPLLEAAQPLLRALADMPDELPERLITTLNTMLKREVSGFQSLCHTANIRHEHTIAASYALCTALDEAVLKTSWGSPGANGDASVWASISLTSANHGESTGGDKFFLLLGRLAATPREHTDLLELMYMILGLGFEGRRLHCIPCCGCWSPSNIGLPSPGLQAPPPCRRTIRREGPLKRRSCQRQAARAESKVAPTRNAASAMHGTGSNCMNRAALSPSCSSRPSA
ncbi:type IVB secretion system protein IcmH/DotU [Variovorax dokdonensis]|uniref:Type IVB secretion system protein IcmH/DotU n=1 Tax=Variovorax dokdonensis TaxID=344883 RepID=A0ABT7NC83_9BURK|nr:type IVB secretion system protein IcmH/DotU [Variovorax dokdonensis]MDM0045554.1 type IVB secretion system protein IcmH/DotU [Variovorax dokdonensis]